MLETVRDFAASHVRPGSTSVRLAHARYFATVAAEIAALRSTGSDGWIDLGDREIGNLRAAMAWAFAHGHARLGMTIAHDMWHYFWAQPSGSNENVRWGQLALDLIDDDGDDVLLVAAGTVIEAYNLGDLRVADGGRPGSTGAGAPRRHRHITPACRAGDVDHGHRSATAEAYLIDAWQTGPLRPESISILNNRIELSWLTGDVRDGATMIERLGGVLATMPVRPQMVLKIEAGVAAVPDGGKTCCDSRPASRGTTRC